MDKATKQEQMKRIEDLPADAERAAEVKGGQVPDAPDMRKGSDRPTV